MSTSTMTQDPPAAAVEKDAHWSAKMKRLRDRKPLSAIVTFLDDDTADVVREAVTAVNTARRAARAELAEAGKVESADVEPEAIDAHKGVKAAISAREKAEAAHDAANVVIELQGLPGDVYDALLSDPPLSPTPDQEERGEDYNAGRLIPELVAACCTDPMTPRDASTLVGGEWWDESRGERTDDDAWVKVKGQALTAGEATYLIQTAREVNQNARVSLGKGSGPTRS